MTIEPRLLTAKELAAARDNRLTPLERELLAHIAALESRGASKPMSPMLLQQCRILVDRNEVACTETVADLLAHIAAQDQRIADLEEERWSLMTQLSGANRSLRENGIDPYAGQP